MKNLFLIFSFIILFTSCATTNSGYQNDDVYNGRSREQYSDTTNPQVENRTRNDYNQRNTYIAPSPYWIYRPYWYSPYWNSPYWNYGVRHYYRDAYGWGYYSYPRPWRHRRPVRR